MCAWEVSFKIKYDYPFVKMSEKHPGSRISMWCVWGAEMLHVPFEHEDVISEVADYVEEIGLSVEKYKPSTDGYILTLKCSCSLYRNVWHVMDKNHCIPMHPASFLDGWGYYRMISMDEEDVKKFFVELREFGPSELLQKRAVDSEAIPSSVWVESLFTGMTQKQIEAVTKAYDYGYYSSPREITTESIATSFGISRSTYEEHLRKAENKIMEAVLPYLKLFKALPKKKEELISSPVRSPVVEIAQK